MTGRSGGVDVADFCLAVGWGGQGIRPKNAAIDEAYARSEVIAQQAMRESKKLQPSQGKKIRSADLNRCELFWGMSALTRGGGVLTPGTQVYVCADPNLIQKII